MKTPKNIIALDSHPRESLQVSVSNSTAWPPYNILAFPPPTLDGPVYRLVDGEELAKVAHDRLTMNLNRSLLCRLRAEGMPFVCFSPRRLRYDLAACMKWLISRSFREGQNPRVDLFELLDHFGLCRTPDGVA